MPVLVDHKVRFSFDIYVCSCGAIFPEDEDDAVIERHRTQPPTPFMTYEELMSEGDD